jgi:hypothetical protein
MRRIESPYTVFHVLDGRIASNSSQTSYACNSLREGEPRRATPSSGDKPEGGIPGWDSLWVDLGGEG